MAEPDVLARAKNKASRRKAAMEMLRGVETRSDDSDLVSDLTWPTGRDADLALMASQKAMALKAARTTRKEAASRGVAEEVADPPAATLDATSAGHHPAVRAARKVARPVAEKARHRAPAHLACVGARPDPTVSPSLREAKHLQSQLRRQRRTRQSITQLRKARPKPFLP